VEEIDYWQLPNIKEHQSPGSGQYQNWCHVALVCSIKFK